MKIFNSFPWRSNSDLLIVDVGTGADLDVINYLKWNSSVTAVDYSPDMLNEAMKKHTNPAVTFIEMDAQNLNFPNQTFDYVIASLILSVVPDPDKCLMKIRRVLKPNGKIIIFDKFGSGKKMSGLRRSLVPLIKLMGTDISLRFENLSKIKSKQLKVLDNSPIMWKGTYRLIILEDNK